MGRPNQLYRIVAIKALGILVVLGPVSNAFAVGNETSSSANTTDAVADGYRNAKARIDSGNYPLAITALKKVVAQDSQHADAYNLLGFANRKMCKLDNAKIYYAKTLSISPNHLGALEYQGTIPHTETD